ncbi:MAG: alanine racemase [Candidatus Latescibacteria bacterium]|jgi:D-serine deaminase-like pyridoxal phosphate-dependent protein|nr:alanine racemase [Candidatus Latescibacterota bacterium]
MHINELDTPAYLVDLDLMESNITDMAAHCRSLDMPLRSHSKSHKIPEIAHKQIESGAIGICCQKIGEAEVMVSAGIKDILIPYNIVGAKKVERLTRISKRAVITVALDSEATAYGIAEQARRDGCEVRVIIELDTGSRRCGVQSPGAAATLARQLVAMKGIDFKGIMTYPSRQEAQPFLEETIALMTKDGIPVEMISGGGTGSESVSKDIGCTETRSGSYVWEGMTRIGGSHMLRADRCPCRMLVTVVSTPTPERVIIDGGMKTFTSYPPMPYGHIIDQPEAKMNGMSVEHGHIEVGTEHGKIRVGDRLRVIPLHQEMTLNLHDELIGVRGDQVEVIWPVAGRGKVK